MTSNTKNGSGRSDMKMFPPPKAFSERAHIRSLEQYRQMYERSIQDPEGFWGEVADEFHWQKKWTKVREYDFRDKISIKYFMGAKTNITIEDITMFFQKACY